MAQASWLQSASIFFVRQLYTKYRPSNLVEEGNQVGN